MADDHQALRESIVHGLRSQGWGRIEAENEADDRIERGRLAKSIALSITPKQRVELRHHTQQFARPVDSRVSRNLWEGISPFGGAHGVAGTRYHLLEKQHGTRCYRLNALGAAVKAAMP